MIGLTQRQQQCLDFLRSYHAVKGIMPSMQEIIDDLQLHSKSGAARILNGLEERGHIRRTYRKARAIEFVGQDALSFLSSDVKAWVEEAARLEQTEPVTLVRQIIRERAEYEIGQKAPRA